METVIYRLDRVDSTIDWVKQRLSTFSQDVITVVSADEQTAGVGRLPGRVWSSPPGVNLYITFCQFVDVLSEDVGLFPQRLAKGVCRVLTELGLQPSMSPPNDVKIEGKKIAGVKVDVVAVQYGWAILSSIGLNVNMSQELVDQVGQPATSLFIEKQKKYDKGKVLSLIIRECI